ncbi:hypothetical protein OAO87_03085 [bacterium]|nr:hypothetical protein [bacterium]
MQSANLIALGMRSKHSKNPSAKAFVARMSKQSSSFHMSGVASKGLQAAQIERGVPGSKVKSTECANATRWTGIFRCATKTRLLEPDIKIGLTGEADGVATEMPADVPDGNGGESGSEASEEESQKEEGDSDAEQVVANEVAGKKFPLAHRCLNSVEFKQANQLESVMLPSHETVTLMQTGSGVDPGTSHLLAIGCVTLTKSPKLQVVSGSEGHEVWKDVHETSIDKMFRMYRSIFSEQMEQRFSMTGHPGKHVLLCWKMNPSVDTTKSGALFVHKPSVYELMQGEYTHKLRMRYNHTFGEAGSSGVAGAAGAAATPREATAAGEAATGETTALVTTEQGLPQAVPAGVRIATPDATMADAAALGAPAAAKDGAAKGGKRRLSILSGISKFQVTASTNETAVEDKIKSEMDKFEYAPSRSNAHGLAWPRHTSAHRRASSRVPRLFAGR